LTLSMVLKNKGLVHCRKTCRGIIRVPIKALADSFTTSSCTGKKRAALSENLNSCGGH
jgi:hypothetical protein